MISKKRFFDLLEETFGCIERGNIEGSKYHISDFVRYWLNLVWKISIDINDKVKITDFSSEDILKMKVLVQESKINMPNGDINQTLKFLVDVFKRQVNNLREIEIPAHYEDGVQKPVLNLEHLAERVAKCDKILTKEKK